MSNTNPAAETAAQYVVIWTSAAGEARRSQSMPLQQTMREFVALTDCGIVARIVKSAVSS